MMSQQARKRIRNTKMNTFLDNKARIIEFQQAMQSQWKPERANERGNERANGQARELKQDGTRPLRDLETTLWMCLERLISIHHTQMTFLGMQWCFSCPPESHSSVVCLSLCLSLSLSLSLSLLSSYSPVTHITSLLYSFVTVITLLFSFLFLLSVCLLSYSLRVYLCLPRHDHLCLRQKQNYCCICTMMKGNRNHCFLPTVEM